MAWTDIIPNTKGQPRGAQAEGVTVSWRSRGKTPGTEAPVMRLGVYIRRATAKMCGWTRGSDGKLPRFAVQYDAETNALRFAPVTHVTNQTPGFAATWKDGTIGLYVPLDHLSHDHEVRDAAPVDWARASPWMTIVLPDWARPAGIEAARRAKTQVIARMAA